MTDMLKHAPAWLQCNGKEQYSSPAIAAKVSRRRNRSKKFGHKGVERKLTSYRCKHCGFFHIGGSSK